MTKKLLRLIVLLATIFICATVCGCSVGMESLDDILNKNDLTARITYFSNGGWFNDVTENLSRDIYYKENSKAFEITQETATTKVKHKEYIYAGWYTILTVELDGEKYFACDITEEQMNDYLIDDDSVIKKNNGEYLIKIADYQTLIASANVPLLKLDELFDFENTTLNENDEIYLATKWVPDQKVEYVLITEDCASITINGEKFDSGEVIATKTFDNDKFSIPSKYTREPVSDVSDAKFVDFYKFEDGASVNELELISGDIARPESGNVKIFLKYVADSSWKIVRTADDAVKIFSSPNNNYYISRDVDCSSIKEPVNVIDNFDGVIRGNGHTITGLKVKAIGEGQGIQSGDKVALFGNISENAQIKDITFKDTTITCTTRKMNGSFVGVYLFAITNSASALSNFNLDGVELNIDLKDGVNIENIPFGSTYDTTSWFCGGYTNSEFLGEFNTVQIKNYELIINESVVATDKVA